MLDWMTLRLHGSLLSDAVIETFRSKQDRIMRVRPNGELKWDIPARESIRSDSHQITVRLTDEYLELMGSPARTVSANNVFGSSDPIVCFYQMINYVESVIKVALPKDYKLWKCTRIDITENYLLDSLTDVKQALNYLRHTEGGRYQVKTAAETVYWSQSSRLRSGKAYAKGPHLKYLIKKKELDIEEDKLEIAHRLLRLELKLGSQFFYRNAGVQKWHEYSELDLKDEHQRYFSQFIGNVEIMATDDVLEKLLEITTDGQAKATYMIWLAIQQQGLEKTKNNISKSTWHRHKKLLQTIGISWADFNEKKITPIRQKRIILKHPIENWKAMFSNG